MEKNQQKDFVTYLKVIACILITNSHCREIYPLYFLAIGGGFGNAIFFILSGYCLADIKFPFKKWYKKRCVRILLPLCITICMSLFFVEKFSFPHLKTLLTPVLFYGDKYWFASAILLYYIIFFYVFKTHNLIRIKATIIIHIIGYIIIYLFNLHKPYFWIEPEGFSVFKVYFYFGILLLGGYLRTISPRIEQNIKFKRTNLFLIFSIIFSALLWVWVYAMIVVFKTAYTIQFLIHLCVCIFAVSLLVLAINLSSKIKMLHGQFGKLITLISASTLEIYLIQVTILPYFAKYDFPINFIFFWGIAFIGGIIFHIIIDRFHSLVFPKR